MCLEHHFSNSNRIVKASLKCCYPAEVSSIVRGVVPTAPILGACSRKLTVFAASGKIPPKRLTNERKKNLTRTLRQRINVKNVELLPLVKETVIFVLAFQIAVSPRDNRVTIFPAFCNFAPTASGFSPFHRRAVQLVL